MYLIYVAQFDLELDLEHDLYPESYFLLRLKDIPKNHIGSNIEIDNAATYNKSLPMHIACNACI